MGVLALEMLNNHNHMNSSFVNASRGKIDDAISRVDNPVLMRKLEILCNRDARKRLGIYKIFEKMDTMSTMETMNHKVTPSVAEFHQGNINNTDMQRTAVFKTGISSSL